MALINWNPTFSVSNESMDSQHKALIEIINHLHEAMRSGKGSQELGQIVDKMIEYAQRHFQAEEQLLAAHQYPGFTYQKAQHEAFIKKALEFKRDVMQGKIALTVPLANYLKEWWTNHIQADDKKYGAFLNAKGIY